MKQRPPPDLPACVVAEVEWITREPRFSALVKANKSKLQSLCKDKLRTAWHRLSTTEPVIARDELIYWTDPWRSGSAVPDREWLDRELALKLAFRNAFFLAVQPYLLQTTSIAKIKQRVDSYRERAKRLRAEADAFLKLRVGYCNLLDLPVGNPPEHAQALNRAAVWYETEADEFARADDPSHPLYRTLHVVGRHQAPPHVRGYVMRFANTMRHLYGQDLRTSVARIATVVLDYEVSPDHVRYWCENKDARNSR
jgi:hypothetical protein